MEPSILTIITLFNSDVNEMLECFYGMELNGVESGMLTEDFAGRVAIVVVVAVLATFSAIPLLIHFQQDT